MMCPADLVLHSQSLAVVAVTVDFDKVEREARAGFVRLVGQILDDRRELVARPTPAAATDSENKELQSLC